MTITLDQKDDSFAMLGIQNRTTKNEQRSANSDNPVSSFQHPVSRWHALYTRSRNEKKVAERLQKESIEAYVPLRKTLHQWSDRKKWVEEPLIRSYVFVKIFPEQYYQVLNTPGAVRYVFFSGKAATIPERQIEILKLITGQSTDAVAIPDTFKPGTMVKVTGGPLTGLVGEMVHRAGKHNVVVRIDHIDHVLSLTISPAFLEPIL